MASIAKAGSSLTRILFFGPLLFMLLLLGTACAGFELVTQSDPPDGGAVFSDPIQPANGYKSGDNVKLEAVPSAGYVFSRCLPSGGTTPSTVVTMNAGKTMTAVFTPVIAAPSASTTASEPGGASPGVQVVIKEVPVTVEVPVTRVVVKEIPVTVEVPVTRVMVKEIPVTVEVPVTRIVEKPGVSTVVVVATPTPQPVSRPTGSSGAGPDLVIEELTSQPANPAAGDKVIWEVTVRNHGSGNANGFRTSLHDTPNPSSCIRNFSYKNLSFLGAGQSETVRLTNTVKAGMSYWLVVDSCDKVQENNEGARSHRIKLSMAELVIEGARSQPANPVTGDKVIWEVTVRNQGSGNANGFRTSLHDTPNPSSCIRNFSYKNLSFLGAGQSETVRLTNTVKARTNYWLVVDSCDKVPESDEGNNSFQIGQVR